MKKIANGSNVIIEDKDDKDKVLWVKANYGDKKWMLPGGRIERGELPKHAAQSETEEESGFIVYENDLELIGLFTQKPDGLVALYKALKYEGKLLKKSTAEITERKFFSKEWVITNKEEFGLGYLRLYIHYLRAKDGIVKTPIECRLADPVDYIVHHVI